MSIFVEALEKYGLDTLISEASKGKISEDKKSSPKLSSANRKLPPQSVDNARVRSKGANLLKIEMPKDVFQKQISKKVFQEEQRKRLAKAAKILRARRRARQLQENHPIKKPGQDQARLKNNPQGRQLRAEEKGVDKSQLGVITQQPDASKKLHAAVKYDVKSRQGIGNSRATVAAPKTESEIKTHPRSRPPIHIPMGELRKKGMVTSDMKNRSIVEEFRYIKSVFQNQLKDSPKMEGRGLVVTSSLPGEGKTFTSFNLVMSLSFERDKRYLYVDADLERYGASRLLNVHGIRPGLKDYLEDESLQIGDIIFPTDVENVDIIPVGVADSYGAEAYGTKRMEVLIKRLIMQSDYDAVVFDTPPVLLSSATNTLCRYVKHTLFVVAAEETPSAVIVEAQDRLKGDSKMGVVLNKMAEGAKVYGSYGSYYKGFSEE